MMPSHQRPSVAWPAVLVLAAGAIAIVYGVAPELPRRTDGLASGMLTGAALLASLAAFARSRRPDAWRSARAFGLALLALAVVGALFVQHDLSHAAGRSGYDVGFLATAFLFLVPAAIEYREHLAPADRRELVADAALIAAAVGSAAYLYLREPGGSAEQAVSSAAAASVIASTLGAYAALVLWLPSRPHLAQLLAMAGLIAGTVAFAADWAHGAYRQGDPAAGLPLSLSPLVLALAVTLVPRHRAEQVRIRPARYGRAALTTLSVATACAALALVAWAQTAQEVEPAHARVLIGLLAGAIALRILVNQVRGTQATQAAQEALEQKEIALRETDRALERLRRANETLRESEERLRTVFEAAVDGIVELDDEDVIVRANEAFCRMVELPQALVEGQPWSALAAAVNADESFASLPQTGQGTLRREGQPIYLESRISEIPSAPPRRLLLVRDVTATRVADQTIRSLFKFLQDRDEDRTRIMRRTNAAIEAERNRIARDLHDGPVQGVSAASLSLEAVLLMLKAGEVQAGIEILAKVRRELSEEADNLRRLMAGLRPPLLEERGLLPALRETLDKWGRDVGVETEFVSVGAGEIPSDLETLAYRVVQEALSNAAKHARASHVTLTVEIAGGQLRVEVQDDGIGFDASRAREYLQMGRVGLASMRERVELANGTFMVHSTPGRGTTVMAAFPLEAVPAPREFSTSEA